MFISLLLPPSLPTTNGIRIENLDLSQVSQDWGSPHPRASVEGHPLSIGGMKYADGLGTHANSEFTIQLHRMATRFTAKVGVDDEVSKRGTVQFQVDVDGKTVFTSPVLKGEDPAVDVSIDLRNATTLTLIANDGGDGNAYDHADWADAKIETRPGKETLIKADVVPSEPTIAISMNPPARPEINGPRVIGLSPNKAFIFKIPCSGNRPFHYQAIGLPRGLVLDTSRGIITGEAQSEGNFEATIKVSGPAGQDSRRIRFSVFAHQLAKTPPMGWNSWNVWGTSVDADKVRAAADRLVDTRLADFGYQYVNIDDAWEGKRSPNGEIQANEKFGDMASLADYVHGLGLRLGIYSSPGPKTCAGFEGSYNHELQDAKTWASWGVDYLKYDWCSYSQIAPDPDLVGLQKPYRIMRNALDQSGRDIVFSLCQYGMGDVYNWGGRIGGNLWRTTGDITDTWNSMSGIAFSHSPKAVAIRPGGWNDPDMLVVGNLGWGPHPRPTQLKPNEQITHISMWAMLAAPLIIGCDLTTLDPFTKAILTNHDILEVDQDPLGVPATRRRKDGNVEIWSRRLWDGTYAVSITNVGSRSRSTRLVFQDISPSLKGNVNLRDLWTRKDLGSFRGTYIRRIPAHGTAVLKLSVK